MHYLLFYDVVDGYGERRQPFRAGHLERARQAVARGELVLGGALGSPGTFHAFGDRDWTCGTNTQQAPYSRVVLLDLKSNREESRHGPRKKDQKRALRARRT